MKYLSKNRSIRYMLFGTGVLFILSITGKYWDEFKQLIPDIHWTLLVLSLIISFIGNLFTSFIMRDLFSKYKISVSYGACHRLFFYGQVAKYIPGKIWTILYQKTFFNNSPNPNSGIFGALLFVNLDLTAFMLVVVTTVSLALILFAYSLPLTIFVLFLGLLLSFILVDRCYIFAITTFFLNFFKIISFVKICQCQEFIQSAKIPIYYFLISFAFLASQWLMMVAVFNFPMPQTISLLAYLGISWILGIIIIVFPGGIGIKEFFFIIISNSFSTDIPLDVLTTVAVISRVWCLAQELLGVSFVFIWNLFLKKNSYVKQN